MLSSKYFVELLQRNQIDFFTGVPDSLLKNICAYIAENVSTENNIVAANEGAAIGLAAGRYLSTGKIPVVYMQNSGIGNAVNPLMSLIDKEVYNIPLLLLIGWRGEPGIKDEPQHIKQGKVTIPLLETMGIQCQILAKEKDEVEQQFLSALKYMTSTKEPFAFIIQKGTFEDYALSKTEETSLSLGREEAIQTISSLISSNDVVVSTTGMISRELFEYREAVGKSHSTDFLTVGSMGHSSQIALGIALSQRHRNVYCFDGDGAILMHMGSLAIIGSMKPKNFIHVVFNNGAHDSVGGQPTVAFKIDLPKIALACGYKFVASVSTLESLKSLLSELKRIHGPVFLEVRVKKGARKDLGRPTSTPIQNKQAFMEFLK